MEKGLQVNFEKGIVYGFIMGALVALILVIILDILY